MSHQQKHAILVCGEFPGLSNQNAASCKIWFCTFCDFGRDVDNFLGSQIQAGSKNRSFLVPYICSIPHLCLCSRNGLS